MNLLSLLFVLCLLITSSECGPEIFKFTSQPESKTVNLGGSVTLSCVATGRTGITYSWYKLTKGFATPPSEGTDLISGATTTQYVVQAADVDDSGEKNLFQCKATAGDDVILSDVATVKYTLADNIKYTGTSSIDTQITTPDDEGGEGVYLFRLQCNQLESDFDKSITNGEPYDVQWFKEGETGRVEDKHDNMWTYYDRTTSSDYQVEFHSDSNEVKLSKIERYDLVIFNVRESDEGTYSCKAVSRVNKKAVLLGSTNLTVPYQNDDYYIKPHNIVTGYMVLAVDDTGELKSSPNVGDKVLLMCGVACRTSSGSYDAQYQWKVKDSTGTLANTREYIVTTSSEGSVTFTCEILNSECYSTVSSKDVTFTVTAAEINPMLDFTFSKSPPEYMWYDTSDNTKFPDPFEIACEGSLGSSGNVAFFNSVYKMPDLLTGMSATEVYKFSSSFTSDKSGVYQCVMYNNPEKVLWYQKTTNVVIAAPPTAVITPTTISVKHGTTATYTCTAGGYPIESVTISGPNNVNSDCITSQSSGDVTCSSTDKPNYVVNVQNFKLEYAGIYKCTVKTKWYKSDSTPAIENSGVDTVTLSYESTTELTANTNSANKGSSVTLTCIVKGNPAPSKPVLTKTVDSSSSDIVVTCSGTTTKTCEKVFSPAEYTDSGNYKCEGSNLIDNVSKPSSDSLQLNISGNVNATITQAPADAELEKGSLVTFTCKVEGNPRPTKLTFKKGDQPLKSYNGGSDDKIVKETYYLSYEHPISSLKLDDTAVYTCEGDDDNGGTQPDIDTKTLTVMSGVTVTITASSETPTVGDTFTITCTATGGLKPYSVELKHDNTLINSGVSCSDDGDYSRKCTHAPTADYSTGGTYSCIGKNKVAGDAEREDTKDVKISVSKVVSVSLTPASETEVTSGTEYTITCNVDGGDKPHKVTLNVPGSSSDLTWQRDSSPGSTFTCTGQFELVCKYGITSLAYSHQGQYTCTGYNKLPHGTTNETKSASGSLVVVKNVAVKLTDSITSSSNEVYYGGSFTITCAANGGRIPFYLEFNHTPRSSTPQQLVLYDTSTSKTPDSVKVDDDANTLTYDHPVTSSSYDDNGTYTCLSKNKAALNGEQNAEKDVDILVVKNVTIAQINDIKVDYGTTFTFTFTLDGGRSPHFVRLDSESSQIFNWGDDRDVCTGTNTLTCTKTIGASSVNWGYDGTFTVTAKNNARNNNEVTATKKFSVTVYKDVEAAISPSSENTITYHQDKTITCNVEGGLPPHQVDLFLPNLGTKIWKRDGSETSLTCSGRYELTCTYTFKPEYDSDGDYKCKGYNEARSGQIKNESVVKLTTVRSTEVTVSNDTMSVLTNGTIEVDCIIEGKPLVDKSSVTWTHSDKDLDLSEFVKTVNGTKDDFTLKSTLNMTDPKKRYAGIFNCTVQDGDKTISKSVEVFINNRVFLDPPEVTHTGGEFIEEGFQISVTCRVEGFPLPSATLTYKNEDGTLSMDLNKPNSTEQSKSTSTEFVFSFTTNCNYQKYKFSCNTITKTSGQVLSTRTPAEGPSITGCENPLPVIIGGGVGGGMVFIIIIVVAVVCILKRIRGNQNGSYSPKNGTQIPNPAFSPDPNYATVRDNQGVPGYSHLNRPAGETSEDGYASIGQMKPSAVPPLGADAYATLDTASNGRMGHKRAGSDEAYAALNRPAPGKEKRGVVRKYKPIANKPKNTFGMPPSKPITDDIEMGETSHSSKPEPTYATVNAETKKSKAIPSEYADVTLPDYPPEVPVYGQMSSRQPIAKTSEYADVTIIPDFLPEVPLYSNMSNRQESAPDEDPVYAQVDLKSRSMKTQPTVEDDDELPPPPDVPVYGTMGELTEPYNPDPDEEDPYATVEFVPKSKRKPPRPKLKESTSEGLYATITDIKENL